MEIVSELPANFSRAWYQHDMDALAGTFHEDASFVNMRRSYPTGREQIRAQHAAGHAGPSRDSVVRLEVVDARELAAGVHVAHVRDRA